MARIKEQIKTKCKNKKCLSGYPQFVLTKWSCGCHTIKILYGTGYVAMVFCDPGCFLEHCGQEGNDPKKHQEKKGGE